MLLWRKAPRIWKAKGFSQKTVVDALEAKFGIGRKLGRTPVSILVKTRFEPCPPDVERFIRDELPVKNEKTWAEYLAQVATEPDDDPAPAEPRPRSLRDVALDAAAEAANTIRSWLDAAITGLGGKLEALASSMLSVLGTLARADARMDAADRKLDSANAKLDSAHDKLNVLQATLNHTDAKIDVLVARLDRRNGRFGKLAVVCGFSFAVFGHCQHAPATAPLCAPAVPALPGTNANVDNGVRNESAGRAESDPTEEREGGVRSDTGKMEKKKTGRPVPRKRIGRQAMAPCQGSETTLYGLCWKGTEHTPPCPPDEYEEGPKCYIPMFDPPKEPSSETPDPERR